MKKMRKIILPVWIVFILSILSAVTVSAAKIGDPYTWAGVQIGWVLVIAAVVITLILWYALKTAPFKKALPILAIIGAIGLVLAMTDVAVEPAPPGEITPGVTWSVSATAYAGANITIDNDANDIIIMAHVNSTEGIIQSCTGNSPTFVDPIINFTISPSQTVGLTDLDLGATTLGSVTNPDQAFTVSGTSYDLFSDVSGVSSDKDLAWVADGTTEYEFHYCTVQFGTSEVAQLTLVYNPAGVSQLTAGTIKTTSVTIGGTLYSISIIIVSDVAP